MSLLRRRLNVTRNHLNFQNVCESIRAKPRGREETAVLFTRTLGFRSAEKMEPDSTHRKDKKRRVPAAAQANY